MTVNGTHFDRRSCIKDLTSFSRSVFGVILHSSRTKVAHAVEYHKTRLCFIGVLQRIRPLLNTAKTVLLAHYIGDGSAESDRHSALLLLLHVVVQLIHERLLTANDGLHRTENARRSYVQPAPPGCDADDCKWIQMIGGRRNSVLFSGTIFRK